MRGATPGARLRQLHRLLSDDWASSQGVVILNESLSLDEVTSAPLLSDARTMLEYVATKGPIKETAAHNLPRSAVDYLTPRLKVLVQRESEFALEPRGPWEIESGTDLRYYALGQQVLQPLAAFGLLEMRILPGPASAPWRRMPEYRVTPLFDGFFGFTVGNAGAPRMRLVR